MNDTKDTTKQYDDVLEENVSHLLEGGSEPPRMTNMARAKLRAKIIAKHGSDAAAAPAKSSKKPLFAVGLGLAAAAAGAAVVTHFAGKSHDDSSGMIAAGVNANNVGKLDDGSTWIVEPGAKVVSIGPRHVRVTGAALLDVVPGKGVFTVETEQGTIEVLGTKFYVSAEAMQTTAAVVRGSVKLATSAGEVVLHAGEQGIAEHAKPPTRGPAPRLSHLVSWAAQARRKAEGTDVEPLHHGTLFAKDPGVRSHPPWGEEYPLPMKQLKVDVVVENQVARIALDQTFHNNETQALEGTYRFAIPPDAALQRLAMYVDGNLMESAVVERMAARKIYEELVYRRVDPALLEWAGTGRLNLRVYPIPALQDKRIMLAYTQSLPKLYDDWTMTVPFPEIDSAVGAVDFDVRVKNCKTCELSSTSHQISSKLDGDDVLVSYHATNEKIGDSLVLHVRDTRPQTTIATTGSGDERYMMVRAPSKLDGDARPYRPRTWVILDDVSASRGKMERRAQADLVESFLSELDEEDKVSVVAFDVQSREILSPTRVLDVDHKKVRKALDLEGDVGATDFAVALDAATKLLAGTAPEDAMIVYLGDGVITSGTRKLDELRKQLVNRAHFIGVGVGDGPDTQTMDSLASSTGGFSTTIDLSDDVSWRAFDLVAALHTARATGIEARLVDDKGALIPSTLYVRAPQVADGEEIELVAKLAGSGTPAAVELTGTRDGKAWTQKIALADAAKSGGDGGYLPRLWAQRHVAARLLAKHDAVNVVCADTKAGACPTEIEARQKRDEEIRNEVVGLGKKYFLLSRHTSLLVLENDAMYAQYGVTKGAGDTWAPYAMPAKIPVVVDTSKLPMAIPANVATDAELARAQQPIFYDYSAYYNTWQRNAGFDDGIAFGMDMAAEDRTTAWGTTGARRGGEMQTRTQMHLDEGAMGKAAAEPIVAPPAPPATTVAVPVGDTATTDAKLAKGVKESERADEAKPDDVRAHMRQPSDGDEGGEANKQQDLVITGALAQQGIAHSGPRIGNGDFQTTLESAGGGGRWIGGGFYNYNQYPMQLVRFTHPADQSFDDLAAWVPALMRDGFTSWRQALLSMGGAKAHTITPAAKDLLVKARAALPSGVYHWDSFEIAIDAQRRMGWRRITDANLHETASYDGTTWTRRYSELGLDTTRAVGDDAVALYLSYMPLLVADPAAYARWFDVASTGKRITLSVNKKVMYQIELDDQSRVVSIEDAAGTKLVEIAWSSSGPMGATVAGKKVDIGFVAQAVGDAMSWAHGAAPAQPVVVQLPVHLVPFSQDAVKNAAVGSAQWRQAQRQLMAAYLAVQNRGSLAQAYRELLSHGGVELGDLALAAPGLVTNTSDKELADSLAPFGTKPDRSIIARYILASRNYAKDGKPASLAHTTEGGLVAQLFTLREASAKLALGQGKSAVDTMLTLDGRATSLRTMAAAMVATRYDVKPDDIARAWEGAAFGPMKNVARAQAAIALFNRGNYDAGAERVAALVADLDLNAEPPELASAASMFASSRRGQAGWQIVWASWRERVLASGNYAHVMSLLPAAQMNPNDTQTILARAAVLAGDDPDKRVALARIAISRNEGTFARSMIDPLLATHPTHDLWKLAASLAITQGRTLDALNALENAQTVAGDEAVDVNTVRTELGQIIGVARQLAVQSVGKDRQSALDRAMAWGNKWRAVDQGNTAIDQMLGDLLLAVGDTQGAWRQLSTVIERNPMAGDGYMTVADTFERQGKVAEALEFWQQAVVIEQTNPTPRLRKAQALIALGRGPEGDAILKEISTRTWHDQWSGVVWQAKSLLDNHNVNGSRMRGNQGWEE